MLIPTEIREAAHIDGANSWQTFKNITLPLIRPITVFVITMSVLTGMQEFTAQYVMTGGGPSGATRVLALMIYETGFNFMRMGKASAISVLLFIVLLSAAFCQRQWLGLNDY